MSGEGFFALVLILPLIYLGFCCGGVLLLGGEGCLFVLS